MPYVLKCPVCGKPFEVAQRAVGSKVACPHCKAVVDLATPAPNAVPAPALTVITTPKATHTDVVEVIDADIMEVRPLQPISTMQRCPFCAELVLAGAKKCKHCGEIIDAALRAAIESHRAVERMEDRQARRGSRPNIVVQTNQQVTQISQQRQYEGEESAPFPHGIHIALCILTCGAWLPFYFLHVILASRGGGTFLAWLIGVPLCLGLLACGASACSA
jgi:hypothetical protein